jgi:hypothetical protein
MLRREKAKPPRQVPLNLWRRQYQSPSTSTTAGALIRTSPIAKGPIQGKVGEALHFSWVAAVIRIRRDIREYRQE